MLLDINDPQKMGLLSLGLRLMSTPGKLGAALGQSGLGALGDMQQVAAQNDARKSRGLQQQLLMQQLEQAKALQEAQKAQAARQQAVEAAYRDSIVSPAQQALAGGGGPTVANAQAMQGLQPTIDQNRLIQGLMQADPMAAYQMMQPKQPIKAGEGDVFLDPKTYKPIASVPKSQAKPAAVQEFEYGMQNPAFNAWDQGRRRASATNIGLPKIEVKTGESVAGQVGAMAKDSKIKVGGAITMFDAADRIEKALDSNLVTSGPFASKIQTVKQLVQVIGGGNDEGIRQTQQVIRGLAKMAVEARKQLQGQGQITENEAAAVLKADAGDIDSMTTGELRDLVTLTKRAAHFSAMEHKGIIDTMQASEATRGLVPYYQVRGMDSLINYSPVLPQIGGAVKVQSIEEARKLSPGTRFIDPNGVERVR